MTSYVNQYGTEYAVRKQDKGPALMCRQRNSSKWVLSSTLANLVGDAKTDKELQAVLDKAAADKGWDPIRGFPDWELPMVQEILTWPWMPKTAEEFTAKHFKELDEVRHHMGGSIATGIYDTGPQGIKFSKLLEDGRVDADHTWADFVRCCIAQGIAPVANADHTSAGPESNAAESGAGSEGLPAAESAVLPAGQERQDSFDPCAACRCPECDDDACPQAHCDKSDKGLGCIAPDDDCPPQNPTAAAPASRADAGAAEQSLSAAGSASLAAEAAELPVFDYSGLDDNTAEYLKALAERANMMRSNFVTDMALIVSSAHWYLCGVVAPCDNSKHGNRGDKSFRAWCASIGIGKDTAYRLLNVQTLIDRSTDEELRTLEKAPAKLLYAAAKPSAPAELVQAVKDGDITSHKQYQDLLAKLKAAQSDKAAAESMKDSAMETLRQAQEDAARANEKARASQKELDETRKERDGARDALRAAKMRADKWQAEVEAIKAKPIEAQVVDEAEINRRAQELADKQTAELRQQLVDLQAEPSDAEQASRDAYDSVVLSCRTIENTWKTIQLMMSKMDHKTRYCAINKLGDLLEQIQNGVRACL